MRVFLTGATGFIGLRLIAELIDAGHDVVGLSRSDANSKTLTAAGAAIHHGSIENLESLRRGAADADSVIHCAFNNDFEHLADNCEKDKLAIEALGSALKGSNRSLIVTSFTGIGNIIPGQSAREENDPDPKDINPRVASELGAASVATQGINVSVMRLPMVHDPLKQGIITAFIALARKKGLSAYVDAGANRFPAAPVLDVATLYRLALEKGKAGVRYHAVAEEGVCFREIAEMVGEGLGIPVKSLTGDEAKTHFEYLWDFASRDLSASSVQTRTQLGWHPNGPTLMADLEKLRF